MSREIFWQKHYASLFDLVFIDQRAYAQKISRLTPAAVHWLPVAVDVGGYLGRPEKKRHDIGFVGVINEKVRPKRSRIFRRTGMCWSAQPILRLPSAASLASAISCLTIPVFLFFIRVAIFLISPHASLARSEALSVRSQVNPSPVRPK